MSLLNSELSGKHLLYGRANPSTITWSQPQNAINVMSISMIDFQEQLLMTISAEKYSDPTNREKVIQATKEKGIKEILANTTVDKINNKVSVKYLYKEEKLSQLGENLYGATKRIFTLHNKIYSKQEIAAGMDQYIFCEVENGNYVETNLSKARNNGHQLHFVGYNYVVFSTSTSTKVRMTTDSSMRTESGLCLNG